MRNSTPWVPEGRWKPEEGQMGESGGPDLGPWSGGWCAGEAGMGVEQTKRTVTVTVLGRDNTKQVILEIISYDFMVD